MTHFEAGQRSWKLHQLILADVARGQGCKVSWGRVNNNNTDMA